MASLPWWGSALVSLFAGLVGVVVGAIVAHRLAVRREGAARRAALDFERARAQRRALNEFEHIYALSSVTGADLAALRPALEVFSKRAAEELPSLLTQGPTSESWKAEAWRRAFRAAAEESERALGLEPPDAAVNKRYERELAATQQLAFDLVDDQRAKETDENGESGDD